jgi:hypothetical protein
VTPDPPGPGGDVTGGAIGGGELPGLETPSDGEAVPAPAPSVEVVEASIAIERGMPANGSVRQIAASPGQAVAIDVTTSEVGPQGEEAVYEVRLYAEPDFTDLTEEVSTSQGYRFAFQVPSAPQRTQYELNVDKQFNGDPADDGPLAIITVE